MYAQQVLCQNPLLEGEFCPHEAKVSVELLPQGVLPTIELPLRGNHYNICRRHGVTLTLLGFNFALHKRYNESIG